MMRHLRDGDVVGLLLGYQHLRLYSVSMQSFHETVGCNGSTTICLACVYDEYSHKY